MPSYEARSNGLVIWIAVAVASLALTRFSIYTKLAISGLCLSTVFFPFSQASLIFHRVQTLQAENTMLRWQLASREHRLRQAEEIRQENARLRSILEYPQTKEMRLVPAQVVGMETTPERRYLIVNLGLRHGVSRNLPVVTGGGLAGKTVDVFEDYTTIQTLYDPNSRVSVLDQRSRILGILRWDRGEFLSLMGVEKTADIVVGDTLVSSGMGGIFPKGLLIGTVTRCNISNDPLFAEVEVRPTVAFARLEEVFLAFPEEAGKHRLTFEESR